MEKSGAVSHFTFFNSRLTAVVSIALVLFMLGILILLSVLAVNLSTYVRESMSFDIVLADDAGEQKTAQLMQRLEGAPFVKSAVLISKEEAAREVEKEIGHDPNIFLGFNPLPPMIVVHLKSQYAEIDSLPTVERLVRTYSATVSDVRFRNELLQFANRNLTHAGLVFVALTAILMLIAIALINNTIRLSVYSKRFIINTMRLVGATDGFIRRPFIVSFIWSGIVAAVIANCLLTWILYYFAGSIGKIWQLLNIQSLIFVYICVLVLGIALSIVSTWVAVNRYAGMKSDEMYVV
jgi:cell division transport system permease protein